MKTFFIKKRIQSSLIDPVRIKALNIRFLSESLVKNPFFTPIPYKYIHSKEKVVSLQFKMSQLEESLFYKRISETMPLHIRYSLLIRVRYNKGRYNMAGNQHSFTYNDEYSIKDLHDILTQRLSKFFSDYRLLDANVEYVELNFRKRDKKRLAEFEKDVYNKDNPMTSFSIDPNKNLVNIPISVNEDYLGELLDTEIENDIIIHIKVKIKGTYCNFLDIIIDKTKILKSTHSDYIVSFDKGFKFYLVRDNGLFVLAVKHIDEFTIQKIRYSMNGNIISHIIDKKENNVVYRNSVSEGKEIVFSDQKIVSSKKDFSLRAINKPKDESKGTFIADNKIGVIDTETYTARDDIQRIYALGFKTHLTSEPVIYYIDRDTLDSSKIVLEMVNELLRSKYSETTFYCHNLSGYDIVFILKILCEYNDNSSNKYHIDTILRKDKIIQVKISRDKHSFTIKDRQRKQKMLHN